MYNVRMIELKFEWDVNKDKANTKKHGVTFDEARTVFFDEYAIDFFDPEHSDIEDRFILLGNSFKLNTIVVCHCFREDETKVRIISARKANQQEQKAYWKYRK